MANANKTITKTDKSTVDTTTVETDAVNVVVKEIKKTSVKIEPLKDDDEITVISLIPYVSYKDNKNNDFYKWEEIGHEEDIPYSAIKDMWRNAKTYFKDMWLKPLDERIIKQFGLAKTYEDYDFLMDTNSYTKNNLKELEHKISNLPKGVKETLVRKVKVSIADGKIVDAQIIKSLEKSLDIDLFYLID